MTEPMASDEDITSNPCRVTEVECKGLKQTRPDVIERELERVYAAKNLSEIYVELQSAISDLNRLDAFASVEASLTESRRGDPGTCRLEMKFEEKTHWSARAKTFVQGSEAGVEGQLGLRNLRGCGEKLTLSMEYGSHSLKESAVEFYKPTIHGHPANFHLRLFNFAKSNHHFASSEERLKGVGVLLSSSDRVHSVGYDLGWHQLFDPHHRASTPVQEQLRHQLKSSFKYEMLHDGREARQLSTGWAFRWKSQLSGLLPHASVLKTIKNRLDVQLSWKFLPRSSLSIGGAFGVLLPLSRDFKNSPTDLTERFYLGGVDSVKGFHTNQIGPSVSCRLKNATSTQTRKRDYLGGDVMASAYASLNVFQKDIPAGQMGIYGHVFGDVGNVAPLSAFTSGVFKDNVRQFAQEYRASLGLGIVLPTPVGNFEVNYVWPVRFGKYDSTRPGLQMSFGTEPFTA